ncbi:MAG: DUF47 domain-containing protein [Solirubrobacterales bacterium]
MAPSLKPKNDKFFKFLNESAQIICDGALTLEDFIENNGDGEPYLRKLQEIGERADHIYRKVLNKLGKSFITPFEREDIYSLASKLHGIQDSIYGIMQMMILYKVGKTLNPNIIGLVEILVNTTKEIRKSVENLENLSSKYEDVVDSCAKISAFELEGDAMYRTGVALLLDSGSAANIIDVIKWKEIFERLEKILDYCEDVGDILKGIAVKYV